ncbi:TonB-dependent siderophore receptor [Pseudothauera rhizosphaerae]|uniref:TonB-dependent siderophore receptor n=1 Tax=Pseudothauera rhizosphaerae TaxID=2565932 RepID=A0A4S4ASD0_9RHOO|nr:TonB-dependent receptor [Pseudothauera rhizosphaerae]THF62618.1 TonB-dependent siderophore receptor [Pseudothauera rhizosphaerae]
MSSRSCRRANPGGVACRHIAPATPHPLPAIRPVFNFAPRPLAFAVHVAITGSLFAGAGWMPEAQGQEHAPQTLAQAKTYDIPAGPLAGALNRFAEEAGVLLTASGEATKGRTSPGLKGSYGVSAGFAALLVGTGLEAYRQAGGNYGLRPAPVVDKHGEATLAPVTVTAASERIGVTEGSGSYTTHSSTYGKGQSLRETPQSVTVMTAQRIQDQGLNTLESVMEQTPGVVHQMYDTSRSYFYSRGFEIGNFQIDGNSSLSNGWVTEQIDMALYDSVEVLRGSDALYGVSGNPGGAINLVRKKPTRDFQLKGMLSAGSWNNFRTEADISGPLALDGRVRGRFVTALEDREFFYDHADSDKQVFYGIVEADVTDSTMLTIGAHYDRHDATFWSFGIPRYSNGDDLRLSRSFFGNSSDDNTDRKRRSFFARIDQKFGSDWSLGIEMSRTKTDSYRLDHLFYGAIDPLTGTGFAGRGASYHYPETQRTIDAALKGKFQMFGREHRLTLGANWSDFELSRTGARRNSGRIAADIFDFDPSQYGSNDPYYPFTAVDQDRTEKGFYGSLALKIADPLTLILGGRQSWYDFKQTQYSYSVPSGLLTSVSQTSRKDDSVFTPYIGVVYDINNSWTTYASIADTYQSQSTSLKAPLPGSPLDPITGRNHEIGIKGELFGGRLNTSLALYKIDRKGTAVRDSSYPNTPGDLGSSCCFLDTGHRVSKGIEAELGGEILPGWQLAVGYTYNDNEDKQSKGVFSSITPKHLFKLWTSYQLRGQLAGLKVGGGLTAQSKTYVSGSASTFNAVSGLYDGPTVDYEFTEPGRALVNLFAEYRFNPQWSLALNVNNLFDKRYYQVVGTTDSGNWYGEPRNVMLTLRASY